MTLPGLVVGGLQFVSLVGHCWPAVFTSCRTHLGSPGLFKQVSDGCHFLGGYPVKVTMTQLTETSEKLTYKSNLAL